ncbi:hypothetical protein FACS1894185_4770 [Betaproteobacteria bacterium]|nr:hypothetical protein FACS1894185_4770 [Betaproteobacteria bacterium]
MALKIKRKTLHRQAAARPNSPAAARDLEVLAPQRVIEVGGEKITVRELTFGEQLRYGAVMNAFADAVSPLLSDPENEIRIVLDAVALHWDTLSELVALTVGRERDWIEGLPPADGELLMLAWWGANAGFFVRRVVTYPAMQKGAQAILGGAASSPPSSATATDSQI